MSTPSASSELEEGPASHLSKKIFEGHSAEVLSIAYLTDGKRIASGSVGKTIRIWNIESEDQEGENLEHNFAVRRIAISPDGRKLVSGGYGGVLWDMEGREVMWTKEKGEVAGFSVAISPDGQLIAASGSKEIVLLEMATGKPNREPLQFSNAWCLAFSPDGARLAAGSGDGKVRVFDVVTGETVIGPIKAHITYVTSLVFTVDGQQIITSSKDKSIRIWDAAAGLEVGQPMLGHDGCIWQILLSPDGRHLASGSDDWTVRLWDLSSRLQVGKPLRAQGTFYSVAWAPYGRSIAAGTELGKIHLWDVPPLGDACKPEATVLSGNSPPLTNTSRTRANSLSSSILNQPAGSQPPNRSTSTRRRRGNDFFDSSLDLPAIAHPQISNIPSRAKFTATKPPISATKALKTVPKIPKVSSSPGKQPANVFARILARFHSKTRAADALQASHLPKHSPVVKVPLAEADARLYTPGSKKKPEPVDDDASEESIRDDGCLNAICFCEYFKWLAYRRELRREERRRQERQERRRQEQQPHE
ncbi:WD40-repeat-containing domain protein [Hygrophoropsis aurantiaca]|uniref:WD40-repeat-containing domain protein n=1 Tax=Hygrophoropsis aurantiaca TaxID=72124 RepID=A0ACB7ZTS1_9AGAM|nr:WD40-repeat-containing domain protein [Hygrophoropsis aurantiaca]